MRRRGGGRLDRGRGRGGRYGRRAPATGGVGRFAVVHADIGRLTARAAGVAVVRSVAPLAARRRPLPAATACAGTGRGGRGRSRAPRARIESWTLGVIWIVVCSWVYGATARGVDNITERVVGGPRGRRAEASIPVGLGHIGQASAFVYVLRKRVVVPHAHPAAPLTAPPDPATQLVASSCGRRRRRRQRRAQQAGRFDDLAVGSRFCCWPCTPAATRVVHNTALTIDLMPPAVERIPADAVGRWNSSPGHLRAPRVSIAVGISVGS